MRKSQLIWQFSKPKLPFPKEYVRFPSQNAHHSEPNAQKQRRRRCGPGRAGIGAPHEELPIVDCALATADGRLDAKAGLAAQRSADARRRARAQVLPRDADCGACSSRDDDGDAVAAGLAVVVELRGADVVVSAALRHRRLAGCLVGEAGRYVRKGEELVRDEGGARGWRSEARWCCACAYRSVWVFARVRHHLSDYFMSFSTSIICFNEKRLFPSKLTLEDSTLAGWRHRVSRSARYRSRCC